MKSFRLVAGPGDGETTGCVMSITAAIAGEKHTDRPVCASPVLTEALIVANDAMPAGLREKLLGDMPWKLVGTHGSTEIERRRAFRLADAAVRIFVPMAFRSIGGMENEAMMLECLAPIVDERTAHAAAHAANAAADAATHAAHAAHAAADAATHAAHGKASTTIAATYAAQAAAAHAATYAATYAATTAGEEAVWSRFVVIIDECIAMYRQDLEVVRDERCERLLRAAART